MFERPGASVTALNITEGSHPASVGQGYLDIAGIYTDGHQEGWRQVADRVHEAVAGCGFS
ncbi:MAG: hypothetical protein WKF96_21670 [Solirubrobacteraceae bacterium]